METEEKNKKNKVTITIIIILLIACILGGVFVYLSKLDNKDPEPPKPEPPKITEPSETPSDIKVDTKIDYAFLKLENKKENMIYSPLSINYAFSMLSLGADNNTLKELNDVFGSIDFKNYKNIDNKLSLANSIFIRDTYKNEIKESYLQDLQNKFNETVEVKYDSFQTVDNINNWVNEKTFKLIPQILKETDINEYTELILANALAIKMNWVDRFDTNDTYGNTFYLENGEEYQATTLKNIIKSDSASYYQEDKLTALSMDLENIGETQLEFLAIMPENLSDYVRDFKAEQIEEIDAKLKKASSEKGGIIVRIPKFKFDYQLELKKDLMALGIKDVFNNTKADLTKIGNTGLFVGDCLHKATIDFSEEGIKAAAVTAIIVSDGAAIIENKPKEIIINKPFMFIIRDKETKNIWFTGTVYKPNAWETDKKLYISEY